MKLSIATFYPAHSSNYTKGRPAPVDRITIHHTAGLEDTLRYLWGDPARNGSSHFYVHPRYIEQYVDTDDTAWTNGSQPSNQRAVTIEVRGDWRNGYYDQAALDNLQKLLVELRKHYPNARITYHMDEVDKRYYPGGTLCPADLKHKGYAQRIWDKVTEILQPTPTPPTVPNIIYRPITPKRVELIRAANLWNFSFTDWSKAKAVAPYPAGHTVDVVAEATNAVGGKYYMTAYSYDEGRIRATNGFNIADCKDHVIKPVPAPVPTPTPTTSTTTTVLEQPPIEEPPIDTNPDVPGEGDVAQRLNALEKIVQAIVDFLKGIFKGFKIGD